MVANNLPVRDPLCSGEGTLPQLPEVLARLLDQTGMWCSGDGGSSGPNPELAESEAPSDKE